MPVTTISAARHITPVVIRTLFDHWKTKGRKLRDGDKEEVATDEIFFDEGFHIVKSFIELGTFNTVESLQAFTNTHVPAPPWAAVFPVRIPLKSCNQAADLLIDWFDPAELKNVVGGERWWQVRGLDGVDCEWITEREYLRDVKDPAKPDGKKLKSTEGGILGMEHLESVMLYVHGGAYFWGSINSHRYQIIRYARKFKGRAFAVNYRKAPQYPWPCPLHDVLAAYLYLTKPPEEALHKPIPPNKLVLAGDSAGAGLCVAVLCLLRDMGLELPAGAVLISPWVDLTHSFPSVMNNTHSDIIPPHGFIAKPSATWPVDPKMKKRVSPTNSDPPPVPGHADKLNPNRGRISDFLKQSEEGSSVNETSRKVASQAEMFEQIKDNEDERQDLPFLMLERGAETVAGGIKGRKSVSDDELLEGNTEYFADGWQPKPPKVLMENPNEIPLELRSQIQLYATTEQLTHPLVSPVLQGSLGDLCPLYILAGDGEVLRDEIVYLAHKAAHPDEYPVRQGVLRDSKRQRENVEKFRKPTKVHLQVFDGMCHVLTVFTYTDSAKYAYRSIAQFVKHVTLRSDDKVEHSAFPDPIKGSLTESDSDDLASAPKRKSVRKKKRQSGSKVRRVSGEVCDDVKLYEENKEVIAREVKTNMPNKSSGVEVSLDVTSDRNVADLVMIRERVNIHGKVRSMEPKDQIPALQIPPEQVGLIKEAPVRRWLEGQEIWDKKFSRTGDKVIKRRKKIEDKVAALLARARAEGLVLAHENNDQPPQMPPRTTSTASVVSSVGAVDAERRWGPLDLEDERPPPTAIANRRDTPEALALLRKNIYHTAPRTHNHVPQRKTADVIRAIFDPQDNPVNGPQQSVSEQQVKAHLITSMHGMRIWDSLDRYFMHKKTRQARNAVHGVLSAVGDAGDNLRAPTQ